MTTGDTKTPPVEEGRQVHGDEEQQDTAVAVPQPMRRLQVLTARCRPVHLHCVCAANSSLAAALWKTKMCMRLRGIHHSIRGNISAVWLCAGKRIGTAIEISLQLDKRA